MARSKLFTGKHWRKGLHMQRGKGFLTHESPKAQRRAVSMESMRLPETKDEISHVEKWRNASKVGKQKGGYKRLSLK